MASFVVGAIGAAPAAVSSTAASASTTSASATSEAAAGGAATGWGTGTLTESDLHALVSQMTLSEEIGMVHGEGDPPNSAAANTLTRKFGEPSSAAPVGPYDERQVTHRRES